MAIPHHFVFDLLPAFQVFLHQNLRSVGKRLAGQSTELLFIPANAGAQSAQGKGNPDNDRITQISGNFYRFLHGGSGFAAGILHPNFLKTPDKQIPVLGIQYSLDGCAQHLKVIFFKNASFI